MARFGWVVCLLAMLTACSSRKSVEQRGRIPAFDRIYSQAEAARAQKSEETQPHLVTLSASEMPLPDLLRLLAMQTAISIAWNDALEGRKVSVELNSVPLTDALGLIARRIGAQVGRVGQGWFLGELRAEDRGVLVRSVRRLNAEGLRAAVGTVTSEAGRVATFEDGLFICADRVEVLQRVALVLDSIEAAKPGVWIVQLYLVSVTDEAAQDLGIRPDELVSLSQAFAYSSAAGGSRLLQGSFRAVLQASGKTEGVQIVAKPLAILGDGESSRIRSGVTVPIAKKVVSNEGTVSTQGFDLIQVGINSTIMLREMSTTSAKVTVTVEQGQVTGYVETVPIQSKDEFSTVATLEAGGAYLLGSLVRTESRQSKRGLAKVLPMLFSESDKSASVQIWARIERVGSGAVLSAP